MNAVIKNEVKAKTQKKMLKKILTSMAVLVVLISIYSISVFAEGNASNGTITDPNASFNNVIKFIAGWIGKLGLVVGFIGAIQFAFALRNDDADGKTKGLRTTISGFVVFAITLSLNLFGIV